MIPHPTLQWNEILAAYADGEFEGRDDLTLLKQRVEQWLAENPEARAELTVIRQLKNAWRQTTPPNPAPEVWQPMLAALECMPRAGRRTGVSWRRPLGAAALAATIALAFLAWWVNHPLSAPEPMPAPTPIAEDAKPFAVAAAHEVEILNVEGADTHTLVVGELPLQGLLELAAPGEVTVDNVQPAARDNMLPEVRVRGPGRPMIWARLDTD